MLATERLLLRPLVAEDGPALLDLMLKNRAFLKPWSPHKDDSQYTPEYVTSEIARRADLWAQESAYGFGIFTRADSRLIGNITLSQVFRGNFQNCFVGYWMDEDHNRQGYMREALRAVVVYAFTTLKLHRIEATTLLHNVASQRVLANVGFRSEGVALHYLQIDGRWQDHQRFAITWEDWER